MGADLGHRRRRRHGCVRDRRALGVRTIVTSGSDEKLAHARAWGADVAVNHHTGDVVEAVKEATGKGVDVVVETVGEATWARSLAAVAPAGRVAVCGATTGPNPPAALHRFWWKQLTVFGSSMGSREDFLGAYELVRTGRARVHVDCGVPARRDARRPRAARGGRAARQDRPRDPRLTTSTCTGAGPRLAARHRLERRLRRRGGLLVDRLEVPLALLAVDHRRAHARTAASRTRSRRR